ncbi:MAG TPA: peptide ABC transporter substrate-binding protein [Anaerolineae bacterium]
MRPDIRWQLLLALVCFSLVLSLLSFQVQSAGLCTTRVPAAGGTLSEGIVGAPQHLNPLLSDNFPVDRELVNLIFDGLVRYDKTGRLTPALAQNWTVSEDGLTVRFTLRQGITWHDGEPLTAEDVVFTYRLLQDEAFPGPAALKTLWQSVTINQIDDATVEFVLTEPYAPFLGATTRGILPAHHLQGVTAAALVDAPFNQAPVGTGPFMVNPGQDWRRTHTLRLSPNPAYWRQGTPIATLELRFYPDEAALVQAFAAGEIQAINQVSPVMLPDVAEMPDVRLFTSAAPRYTSLLFNLSASGSPAVQNVEMRRALAYALDRQALVDDVLSGQALPLEGPYLPTNWAYNPAMLTLYDSQPVTATTLLESAGWLLPEGQTVRQREGLVLNLRLLALDKPTHRAVAQAIAGQWAGLGIGTELILVPALAELRQMLLDRAFDVALVDVRPPGDPDLYDFWSQEAIVRGQNYAGWNNRRASEALEAARQVWSVEARRPYYDTFLRLYDGDLPALTLYQHVYTYGLSQEVNRAEIGRVEHPRDRYETLPQWFLLYRDVTVSCPG